MSKDAIAVLGSLVFFASGLNASAQTVGSTPLTAAQVLSQADAAVGDLKAGIYRIETRSVGGGIVSTTERLVRGADYISVTHSGDFQRRTVRLTVSDGIKTKTALSFFAPASTM